MPTKELGTFRGVQNHQIMNAIRKTASNMYQERIPVATKANIAQTGEKIMKFNGDRNEFMDAFVNQIGRIEGRTMTFKNPLGKFKLGLMDDGGDTVQEYMVDLVKSYTYDSAREAGEKAIFGQHVPNVLSAFHTINREEYYPVTISTVQLRRAFVKENGLANLVTQILKSATNSDEIDEFNVMASLFRQYHDNGGFFYVNVPDVGDASSGMDEAKVALRRIHEVAETIQFPSRLYNSAGMPSVAQPEDLELFCTPEFKAAINIEALASLFNLDPAKVPARITVLPKSSFNIPGLQAILTTKDFFVVLDTFIETTNADNPVLVSRNYFFHHHGIYSTSPFVPAVAFWTGAGTVITSEATPVTSLSTPIVTDTDGNVVTTLARGNYFDFDVTAITTPAGGSNNAVRFELDAAKSDFTKITQTGTIFVGLDEELPELTVKYVAVDNEDISAEITYPLTGDVARIFPDPKVIPAPAP